MKKIKTIIRSIFLPFYRKGMGVGFIVPFLTGGLGWLLVSCSDEQVSPGTEEQVGTPVHLVSYMAPFDNLTNSRAEAKGQLTIDNGQLTINNSQFTIHNGQRSMVKANSQFTIHNSQLTRTPWEPPTGYSLYTPPTDKTTAIGAFFTQDSPSTTSDDRRIWFNNNDTPADLSDDKWFVYGKEPPVGSFYMYGYMPYNTADVSITPQTTYAAGATLTFNNMKSVSTKDVCVIVGASHGTDANTPVSLATGKFNCTMKSGKDEGNANHLFLLCEHLYAKLDFKFKVDNSAPYYYASLRTIKLRRVELIGYTYTLDNLSDTLKMKERGSMTVNVTANNTNTSPLSSDPILFSLDNSAPNIDYVSLFEGEEELKSDTYTSETSYVPYFNLSGSGKVCYKLRSTYDVYDTNGNLIRKGCIAENMIVPSERFNQKQLTRGKQYTLQLTVMPTYLYMMSEEDLDNPSFTLE